jgi:hypothetical protein
MRALNCYPGVQCALEPFIPANLNNTDGNISDADTFDRVLAGIWQEYNGIKHVWHPSGWPFGATLDLNRRLLRSKGTKIIFLSRRNELRRAVSSEMSWQTKVWGDFTEAERAWVREFDYKPLSWEKTEHELRSVASGMTDLRDTLRDADASFVELQYEDLFAGNVYLAERLKVLNRLREFIGIPQEYDVQVDFAAADLLNPVNSKLNLTETYQRIPNIAEIEQRFGSDKTGWLFKETPNHVVTDASCQGARSSDLSATRQAHNRL